MRLRVLAVALFPLSVAAQGVTVPRDSVIAISMSRSGRVFPDRASMYVVVDGAAETPVDAVARAATKMKAVSEALHGLGARVEADRPVSYAVGATQAQNGFPAAASPLSYTARSVVRITVTHPDDIAGVAASLLAAGATNTTGLAFESSAADSVHRVRVTEAIGAAHTEAQAMAAAVGGHLGALLDITTSAVNTPNPFANLLNLDNRFNNQQAAPPELNVTATVTVRYRLVR